MSHSNKLNPLKILLLEDDQAILTMMEDVMAMERHVSYSAHRPSEALRILTSEKVDLIISDIRMPEMSGIEFGLRIREEGINIPIIYYSGEANPEETYSKELREIGKVTVFAKAISFPDIAQDLHHYLNP